MKGKEEAAQIIYLITYRRFVLFALSLVMLITSAICCASLSSAEELGELYSALNTLLFTEDSGLILNSSDMDSCMEIAQKVFEDQKIAVKAGCPQISPNKDMVFIPFRIGQGEAMEYRYIVMHKHTADSPVWAHNHSEKSFLGLMKGLYDISFHFIPQGS